MKKLKTINKIKLSNKTCVLTYVYQVKYYLKLIKNSTNKINVSSFLDTWIHGNLDT